MARSKNHRKQSQEVDPHFHWLTLMLKEEPRERFNPTTRALLPTVSWRVFRGKFQEHPANWNWLFALWVNA
jgi:hypothetical protein